jgi:hypothetical protein
MGTGGPFHGGKARPVRDADHSPPSSAEVKNEEDLYLLSPKAPPWRVVGLLCFIILLYIYVFMKQAFHSLGKYGIWLQGEYCDPDELMEQFNGDSRVTSSFIIVILKIRSLY